MSIGTLLAYTIVSASVIILRYGPESGRSSVAKDGDDASITTSSDSLFASQTGKLKPEFWWLSNVVGGCGRSGATSGSVLIYISCSAALCVHVHFSGSEIAAGEWWAIACLLFLVLSLIGCLFVISAHHQNSSTGTFRVPCVPLVPGLSILCNVGLMVHLNALTWVRFVVWMTLGLLVYFLYGIRHSKEGLELATSSSMLMTSSEAVKEPWGAVTDTKATDSSGGGSVKHPLMSRGDCDEERTVLVDDVDCDSH